MNMKTARILFISVVSLLFLTGCVSADYKIKLGSGGGVDMTYTLLFQKTVLQLSMLGDENADPEANPVDIYENAARDSGYRTKRIIENEGSTESEMEGFIATKHAGSVENIEFLAFDTSGDICRATTEEYTYDHGFFRNHYSIKLNLNRMPEAKEGDDYTGEEDGFTYAIMSGLDLKLTIDLPFKPEHSNSVTVENNGRRHIWIPEYYMVTAVELDGYVLNYAVIIPLGVFVLALAAFIAMKLCKLTVKDITAKTAAAFTTFGSKIHMLFAGIGTASRKAGRKKGVEKDIEKDADKNIEEEAGKDAEKGGAKDGKNN